MAIHSLLIMRHAEAEPIQIGLPDVRRQLTRAGQRRAAAQAAVTAQAPPDVVLCSAADRTRQTLAQLDVGGALVHIEESLYEASATSLLLRLATLPEEVGTAWVIGHMPTVGQLTVGLVDGLPIEDFAPGAVAILDLAVRWADLAPRCATLRHLAP